MIQQTRYRFANPARAICFVMLLCYTSGCAAVTLLFMRDFGTAAFWLEMGVLALPAALMAAGLIRGGEWSFEIDEEAIRWDFPFDHKEIRHEEIETFECVDNSVGQLVAVRVHLKSGLSRLLPRVGNSRTLYQTLQNLRTPRSERASGQGLLASETTDASSRDNVRRLSWRRIGVSLLIGAFVMAWGIVSFARTALFVRRTSATQAVIQDVQQLGIEGPVTVKLTYSDAAGVAHTEETQFTTWDFPSFTKGDKVPVLYDPAAPAHVRIDAFDTLWFESFSVLGAGTFFVLGGIALAIVVDLVARNMEP